MLYNPDTPDIIGIESPFHSVRTALLNSSKRAVAMLIEPGAVSANELHSFLLDVAGTPGLALEIVNDLDPAISTSTFEPGGDTDAVTTGFLDQGGGAVNFGDVDDRYSSASYARNSAALSTASPLSLLFGANNAGALTGRRPLSAHVTASATFRNVAGNATALLAAQLQIDGTQYTGIEKSIGKTDRLQHLNRLGGWVFDPSTNLPWDIGQIDDFLDIADNELFGVRLRAQAAATGVRIHGFVFEVDHCLENRMWYAYTNTQPRRGWHQNAMTSLLGAMSANTWYWLVISCPWGSSAAWAKLPIVVSDPDAAVLSPDAASAVGEVRRVYELTLTTPAGIPTTVPDPIAGFIPALIGNSGTINAISQAYADVDAIAIWSGAAANIGTQLFAPASGPHPMAAIGLEVGWAGNDPPDAPLVVTVRQGTGAISGGGNLIGTATLHPSDAPERLQYVRIPFDQGGINLASSTQYHVLVDSDASAARAWKVFRGDSRPDLLQPTPTTTAAEVQQQTYGRNTGTGEDDSYVEAGVADDRYDLVVQLLKAPAAPTGFAVTVVPAKEIEAGAADRTRPTIREPLLAFSWTPTSLGANFRRVIIERRLRVVPAPAWETVFDRQVDLDTETPATVEANETLFIDSEAGWAVTATPNADGWDYRLRVENHLGLRSLGEAQIVVAAQPPASPDSYHVSNRAWWLRTPIRAHHSLDGGGANTAEVWEALGRDGAVVRVPSRVPAQEYTLGWTDLDFAVESRIAAIREAAVSGYKFALLECRGDRLLGAPSVASRSRKGSRQTDYAADFMLAGRQVSDPARGYNGPAEIVFDGATSYALTGDDPALDPGTGGFAVAVCGRFAGSGGSDYIQSKGDTPGTNDGYGIRTTAVANQVQVVVDGAGGAVTAETVEAGLFNGVEDHVIWLVYDGATLSLYLDDDLNPRATTAGAAGAIANAIGFVVAANNAGASGHGAHDLRCWGYWPAVPTDRDRRGSARYMLGCWGQHVHPGAELFIDVADERTWGATQAVLNSLAGSRTQRHATLAGTWSRRGTPAPISRVERWYAH